jgi:cytochrome c-type biogenesis protein CcmH/NrfF
VRGWWRGAALVLAMLLAVLGLGFAAAGDPGPVTQETQVRAVASGLRCPSCAGEDVADSAAPLARAMRGVIDGHVAEGRSPDQIRDWFAERYGDEVLLDPPRSGAGWWLWLLPFGVLGTATWLMVGARGRTRTAVVATAAVLVCTGVWWARSGADRTTPALAAPSGADLDGADLLARAVSLEPGDAELRLALGRALDGAGRTGEAAEHYAAAARLRPLDPDPAYLQAFALVRSGNSGDARAVLEQSLDRRAEHAPTLLLLGTLWWEAGDQGAAGLLRRFLDLDPGHPAADQVRVMLEEAAQ